MLFHLLCINFRGRTKNRGWVDSFHPLYSQVSTWPTILDRPDHICSFHICNNTVSLSYLWSCSMSSYATFCLSWMSFSMVGISLFHGNISFLLFLNWFLYFLIPDSRSIPLSKFLLFPDASCTSLFNTMLYRLVPFFVLDFWK